MEKITPAEIFNRPGLPALFYRMGTHSALFETMQASLADYDTGWWSRYSLWAGGRDLAKPFYHRIHVVQLEALGLLTGVPGFAAVASRWREYDTGTAAARAVLAKGREVLAR